MKNSYKNKYEHNKNSAMKLSKSQQEEIQKRRKEVIEKVEEDSISPAAKKLLEENKEKISKQKSEKLSKKNMDLYVNIENENPQKTSDMPEVKKRVIKLNSNIPEDEDFEL